MRINEPWIAPQGGAGNRRHSRGYGTSRLSAGALGKLAIVIIVLLVAASAFQMMRPVPLPQPRATLFSAIIPGAKPSLPWLGQGSGEVDVQSVGAIASMNPDTELPLGSVAKIITALVIVKDHPLALGSEGPTIQVSSSDVALYNTMHSQNDSVIPVALGETLSEYQLLEALLIPSANNFADMLANWDAGSLPAFAAKMGQLVKSLGLHHTSVTGPSGLNSHSVGSAHDQIAIAEALLKNPVLNAIVAKPQATLPGVGIVYNIDYNVGHNGFTGIETGAMSSGGNFVFAATGATGSKNMLVGAILGQIGTQPLITALNEANKLVDAARKVPGTVTVLRAAQTVAEITSPGSNPVPVAAAHSISLIAWPGLQVTYKATFSKLSRSVASGAKVGTLEVAIGAQSQTVPLVAVGTVKGPSIAWRLTRI